MDYFVLLIKREREKTRQDGFGIPKRLARQKRYPSNQKEKDKMGDNTEPQSDTGNLNMTAVQKLRAMLADPDKFITCPGVYDGFTARIALQEGVDCLYMVSLPSSLSPHKKYTFTSTSLSSSFSSVSYTHL